MGPRPRRHRGVGGRGWGGGDRGRGGARKRTSTRFLKRQAPAHPRGPSLGTKRDGVLELSGGSTVDCICLFCVRVTSVVDLFRLFRATLVVARVLNETLSFTLGLFECLGLSAAPKPHLYLKSVFLGVFQLSSLCHFSLNSFRKPAFKCSFIHSFIQPSNNFFQERFLDAHTMHSSWRGRTVCDSSSFSLLTTTSACCVCPISSVKRQIKTPHRIIWGIKGDKFPDK